LGRDVRLRLGLAGVSAALGPAPDLIGSDSIYCCVASYGHINAPSGFSAVVGEVVRLLLVTAGDVGEIVVQLIRTSWLTPSTWPPARRL
jgi:hypothetical protein